ncbi:MAG: hypothetical protein GXO27_03175 [Chlorobi bacterium]|nr:hypothetical protein [Chlorobiota bacterium]
MKNIWKTWMLLLAVPLLWVSCKTEFENHNAASEDAVYSTPEAYPGLALGMTQHFTQNAWYEIVRGPGVVAREIAATNTYLTEPELESGDVPQENASVARLWRFLHYERGIAEKIVENIDNVTFVDNNEKEGIKAYAYFFKGMTTAYLGFYWEMAPVKNDPQNRAEFETRETVLNSALADLDEAIAIINNNGGAANYINNTLLNGLFSLADVIHVYRARIYLELGDYANALNAANEVDLTTTSVWIYDNATSSRNIIYMNQYDPGANERWKGIENMGVNVEAGDQRLAFYLGGSTGISSTHCGFNTNYILGFWDQVDEDIPVYIPDEVKLIKAEALARSGNLPAAVALINEVRTDTNDPFGVNAGLGPWNGNAGDQQAVLDQIFYNYAMESYLGGIRWLAHRRIYPHHLDGVTPPVDCSKERTRNFFPYPYNEHSNNPNTPQDPEI